MSRNFIFAAAVSVLAFGAFAYEWENVGPERRIGGRMISAGYLRGKVVLLDRRDYTDPAEAETIRQLQSLWVAYKSKPFILLGSQVKPAKRILLEKAVERLGVTYPVYAKAGCPDLDSTAALVVLDSTCQRKLYAGNDPHAVQGVIGAALMSASTPLTAKQYEFLLDWELKNLPGRGYLRLREFREKFPSDAGRYAEEWETLSKRNEVKKLAKLVELSRLVKDRDLASKSAQRLTPKVLENAMEKYEPLKQSDDPFVAQEAKNALADIKFAEATLGKK